MSERIHKIGIFDSGFGGLTVYKEIRKCLPQYDYIYLGDNARAPYGPRSFDTVYKYTLQAVKQLFSMNCQLVILACNTASAKALRSIQQNDLAQIAPGKRVLGVLRPCTESANEFTQSNCIGIMATPGTVKSESYPIEITKFFPQISVFQQACPMFVPLVENGEATESGADFFVEKYCRALLAQCADIDAVILGCTHYPILESKLRQHLPPQVTIISQGSIVAEKLENYLLRHPQQESLLSKNAGQEFYTTDCTENFSQLASVFVEETVTAKPINLI